MRIWPLLSKAQGPGSLEWLMNSLEMSLHCCLTCEHLGKRRVCHYLRFAHLLRVTCPQLDGAYPDPDSHVLQMFRTPNGMETKVHSAARYGAFLIALFRLAECVFDQYNGSMPLAQWWHSHLKERAEGMRITNREELYRRAVDGHNAIYKEMLHNANNCISVGFFFISCHYGSDVLRPAPAAAKHSSGRWGDLDHCCKSYCQIRNAV